MEQLNQRMDAMIEWQRKHYEAVLRLQAKWIIAGKLINYLKGRVTDAEETKAKAI
jgi:hypothetical protein